jgi:hypothetical protein
MVWYHRTKHLKYREIDEHEMGTPIWVLAKEFNTSASKPGWEK